MKPKRLTNVKYVHAAAQDCVAGAAAPRAYNVGDVVKVEFVSGACLDVLIQSLDDTTGAASGEVKNGSTDDVALSDVVSFNCN